MELCDIRYLAKEKIDIIDKCQFCHGVDFECSCYRDYNLEVLKVKANIPMKYRKATLYHIKSPDCKKQVINIGNYIKKINEFRKKGVGLYLWGIEGTAKTYLACVVLVCALKNNYSAYFTTMDDIMDIAVKPKFGKFDEYNSFQDTVYKSEFLCIDDIGFSYKPARDEIPYVDSLFFKLIRHRTSNMLPILFTSQKSIIDLAGSSHLGDRTISVLKGHVKKIQFTGKSFRDGLEKSII